MRNILSYKQQQLILGSEIICWAQYQIDNQTSHLKQGKHIMRVYGKTLLPNRYYHVYPSYESWGCGMIVRKPLIKRA